MAAEKPFIELGLTETETHALIQALNSELDNFGSCVEEIDEKKPFMAFASRLYIKSLQGVKEALSQALKED